MATMTKNLLSMNFGRRFHKYLKRTYSIDGKATYTAVHEIMSHEPYFPKGAPLDAIVDEWRGRISRDASGRLTDEPHRLVPLTCTFLKDIEERNQQGAVVKAKGGEFTVRCGLSQSFRRRKEFYEEARYTKAKQAKQATRGWQDRDPRVLESIRKMPTKKTASLEKLKVYIAFMMQRMDVMLEFSQFKPFRSLRLRNFIFMKKKLRQLCERLVPGG
jgi:hypothetical protein